MWLWNLAIVFLFPTSGEFFCKLYIVIFCYSKYLVKYSRSFGGKWLTLCLFTQVENLYELKVFLNRNSVFSRNHPVGQSKKAWTNHSPQAEISRILVKIETTPRLSFSNQRCTRAENWSGLRVTILVTIWDNTITITITITKPQAFLAWVIC